MRVLVMKFLSRLLWIYVSAWLGTTGLAAAPVETPEFYVEAITVHDGLPDSTVDTVSQDLKGFLWFGTMRDWVRYDGKQFSPYKNTQGERSFLGQWIKFVDVDEQQVTWVGTNGYGLRAIHANGKEVSYLPGESITLVQAHDTMKLIGTTRGLCYLDPQHPERVLRYFKDHRIQALHRMNKTTWLVATHLGLYLWDMDAIDAPKRLYEGSVWSLHPRDAQSVWLSTDTSLAYWEHGQDGIVLAMKVDRINSMHAYQDIQGAVEPHKLWLGTNANGLYLVDTRSKQILYQHDLRSGERGLANQRVHKLMIDRSRVLWVTTEDGVRKVVNSSFHHSLYGRAPTSWMTNPKVMATWIDHRQHLWMGMDEGGVVELDEHGQKVAVYHKDATKLAQRLTNNRIRFIHRDVGGHVWIGTASGLNERISEQKVIFHQLGAKGLSHDHMAAIWEDRDGESIWFGTDEGGVNIWNPQTRTFSYLRHKGGDSNSLLHDTVLSLYQTRDGRHWVATLGGLSRIEKDGTTFTHYPADLSRDGSKSLRFRVRGMYEDSEGRLWLATDGGLSKIEWVNGQEIWTHYGAEHGLNDIALKTIEPDSQGRLWISSRMGIGCFDPKTNRFRMFGQADGLVLTSFANQAHTRTKTGDLIFGGTGGFVRFNPEQTMGRIFEAPLVVTKISIAGQTKAMEDLKNLTYRDKHFIVETSVLNYKDPERNRIAYKLEGVDKNWRYLVGQREIAYSNLPAGSYVLHMKPMNSDGVWSTQQLNLPLTVHPAPWATWWARMLYGLGLVGLFLGYRRFLIAKTKRLATIREIEREHVTQRQRVGSVIEKEVLQGLEVARNMPLQVHVSSELRRLSYHLREAVAQLRLEDVDTEGLLGALMVYGRQCTHTKVQVYHRGYQNDGLDKYSRYAMAQFFMVAVEYARGEAVEATLICEAQATRLRLTPMESMEDTVWESFTRRVSAYGKAVREGGVLEIILRNATLPEPSPFDNEEDENDGDRKN